MLQFIMGDYRFTLFETLRVQGCKLQSVNICILSCIALYCLVVTHETETVMVNSRFLKVLLFHFELIKFSNAILLRQDSVVCPKKISILTLNFPVY